MPAFVEGTFVLKSQAVAQKILQELKVEKGSTFEFGILYACGIAYDAGEADGAADEAERRGKAWRKFNKYMSNEHEDLGE
jgi:hypothetical protein